MPYNSRVLKGENLSPTKTRSRPLPHADNLALSSFSIHAVEGSGSAIWGRTVGLVESTKLIWALSLATAYSHLLRYGPSSISVF